MIKFWTINPNYIDDEMLLETYFEGLRLLSLFEGQDYQNKEERRYYTSYFMYAILQTHIQKENLLARYLFEISEVLKWQRNIEVAIDAIVHRQTRTYSGQIPLTLTIPSQQIAAEAETLKQRLDMLTKNHQTSGLANITPLPTETALVKSHLVVVVVQGEITVTAREQICAYRETDRTRKIPYPYTRIVY